MWVGVLAEAGGGGESVAAAGQGFDVVAAVGQLAEGASEQKDRLGEVALLDEAVAPDVIEEIFLGDRIAAGCDEQAQDLHLSLREFEKFKPSAQGGWIELKREIAKVIQTRTFQHWNGLNRRFEINADPKMRTEGREESTVCGQE